MSRPCKLKPTKRQGKKISLVWSSASLDDINSSSEIILVHRALSDLIVDMPVSSNINNDKN